MCRGLINDSYDLFLMTGEHGSWTVSIPIEGNKAASDVLLRWQRFFVMPTMVPKQSDTCVVSGRCNPARRA